ncbi:MULTISPECIES: glycosyltransferase family 2 protein [unclassified Bradyrhizobium]
MDERPKAAPPDVGSRSPAVSFVVPCYRLAEFLVECVESMLRQTYEDFEVIIMDDCSPDQTGSVARALEVDPRVRYIRNESNLGHLRNYNKGISMARGRYIWLISADDRLRSRDVLRRYVQAMESTPSIGFAFCPVISIRDGKESEVVSWAYHGDKDIIFKDRRFLRRLIKGNCIAAPAVLARRECYEKSLFPLDLTNTGDWFLWAVFAMHYDVAYFAEPMVNYRWHNNQMTNWFVNEQPILHAENNLLCLWQMMKHAQRTGLASVAKECAESLARSSAHYIVAAEDGRRGSLDYSAIQGFVERYGTDESERRKIRSLIEKSLGDNYLDRGKTISAVQCYANAIRGGRVTTKLLVKYLLSNMGPTGLRVIDAGRLLRGSRGYT